MPPSGGGPPTPSGAPSGGPKSCVSLLVDVVVTIRTSSPACRSPETSVRSPAVMPTVTGTGRGCPSCNTMTRLLAVVETVCPLCVLGSIHGAASANRLGRHGQHILCFLADERGIGRHVQLQRRLGRIEIDAHAVIHHAIAHRARRIDVGDCARQRDAVQSIQRDLRFLPDLHVSDLGFVYQHIDVQLADVRQRDGIRPACSTGGDVDRRDQSVKWRGERGFSQIALGLFQREARLLQRRRCLNLFLGAWRREIVQRRLSR